MIILHVAIKMMRDGYKELNHAEEEAAVTAVEGTEDLGHATEQAAQEAGQ